MKYYMCTVHYSDAGQSKSALHKEYATGPMDAASRIRERLENDKFVVFKINMSDKLIVPSASVGTVAVLAGE
jgi:hypothetical protein